MSQNRRTPTDQNFMLALIAFIVDGISANDDSELDS